ncbi:MAG: VanZ family protein [Moraxellaceae bacterium]
MFEHFFEKLRWPLRAAFLICLCAVLYLSLDPAPLVKGMDYDKANHVLAFFALGVLLRLAWPRFRVVWAIAALLVLGVLIELVQHFTGRDAAFADVLADILGLVLAVLATQIFRMHPQASLAD